MFYSLTGKIIYSDLNSLAIECGGVGFRCLTSANTLRDLDKNKTVTVYTHLNVREDALDLFGFSTEYELEWFKNLIGVTGVGPKAALAVLSELTGEKLALAICAGDVKAITRSQGIGPKIANRIILELKEKAKSYSTSSADASVDLESISQVGDMPKTSEAVAALTMLGFSQSDALVAVSKLDSSLSVEEMIRQGLKLLSKNM